MPCFVIFDTARCFSMTNASYDQISLFLVSFRVNVIFGAVNVGPSAVVDGVNAYRISVSDCC